MQEGLVPGVILVTGGAGTLGTNVAPSLIKAGYRVRLMDTRPVSTVPRGAKSFVGDLREPADVRSAVAGVVGVIHAAAWHGMHLRDHSHDDFWDLNVQGTYQLYEAAAAAHVKAMVFASTMGVYGPPEDQGEAAPARHITEGLAPRPGDIYGLSKLIGEEISAAYSRTSGIAGASLRYGMFVPEPFHHAGIRFLYGGVDATDVARANVVTLQRLLADGGHLGEFNVFSALPFDDNDGDTLRTDPMAAIARHWPDGPGLLEAADAKPWGAIREVYEIARAERVLGFRPRYGFAQYLDALRSGRDHL